MHFVRRFLAPALLSAAACLPLVLTATPAVAQPTAQPQGRLAVVDTRRAIMETEEGLRVQATLKKLFDSRQVELSGKERTLQQEREDIAKDEKKGPSAALDQKKDAWQQKAASLQQTLLDYQHEMQRKEGEMTNPMLQKMMAILKRLATTEGYEMVVDKAAVPYFRTDLDVTDKLIQMYNADGATAPTTPPKGAPAAKPKAEPKPAPKK